MEKIITFATSKKGLIIIGIIVFGLIVNAFKGDCGTTDKEACDVSCGAPAATE
jgi:hypothetical protein